MAEETKGVEIPVEVSKFLGENGLKLISDTTIRGILRHREKGFRPAEVFTLAVLIAHDNSMDSLEEMEKSLSK